LHSVIRSARSEWSRARKLRDDIGSPLPPGEQRRYDDQLDAARAATADVATFMEARRQGAAMTIDEAVGCIPP
jgi:hypothetical protein